MKEYCVVDLPVTLVQPRAIACPPLILEADWLTGPDLHAMFISTRAQGSALDIFTRYTRVEMDNACRSG